VPKTKGALESEAPSPCKTAKKAAFFAILVEKIEDKGRLKTKGPL
jgi:hypothetical protein